MASNGISDGIENLCLTDQVNKEELGAVPKIVKTQNSDQADASAKKQQKKKNRKDKRRSDADVHETPNKGSQMSKVEKLRVERGVQRSDSDKRTSSPLSSQSDMADLLFRTNSRVNVNMGVKNLPDSFFSDKLPEEIQNEEMEAKERSEGKDHKKRKRRKQKRKQTSTEEEDKQSSEKENIEEDKLNEKLIDDDIGEEIVTNYGDEQCVVSFHVCLFGKKDIIFIFSTIGETLLEMETSRSVFLLMESKLEEDPRMETLFWSSLREN